MKHYATILNGPETLAAVILASDARDRFLVRYIDEETRRDAGIDAVVGVTLTTDVAEAIARANAFVTETPYVAARS